MKQFIITAKFAKPGTRGADSARNILLGVYFHSSSVGIHSVTNIDPYCIF